MAYSLVPDANNTVGSDLTAMYDNFVALESAQIVDSGSTADGDYWRFADGLQICSNTIQVNYVTGNLLRGTWNYPVNFISIPIISSILSKYNKNGSVDSIINFSEISTNIIDAGANFNASSVQIGIMSTTSNYVSGDYSWCYLIAIGRWK